MITAELWTLAQCNNGCNVSAHDKHAQMCKLLSFISLGWKCYLALWSSKQQLFTVCSFTACARNVCLLLSCMPFRWHCHCLMAESMTDWSSCSFNRAISQLINLSNLLSVHSFLHHSPHFVRKHSEQVFCSIFFTFSSGFNQIPSSMLNHIMGTVYLLILQLRHNSKEYLTNK